MLQETCLLWTQAGWSKSEPLPGPYTMLKANRTSPPGGHRGLAAHLSLQLCWRLPKGALDRGSQYPWSGGHSGERSVVASAPWGTHSTWQLCRHGPNHSSTERGRGHKASPAEVRGSPPFRIHRTAGPSNRSIADLHQERPKHHIPASPSSESLPGLLKVPSWSP